MTNETTMSVDIEDTRTTIHIDGIYSSSEFIPIINECWLHIRLKKQYPLYILFNSHLMNMTSLDGYIKEKLSILNQHYWFKQYIFVGGQYINHQLIYDFLLNIDIHNRYAKRDSCWIIDHVPYNSEQLLFNNQVGFILK